MYGPQLEVLKGIDRQTAWNRKFHQVAFCGVPSHKVRDLVHPTVEVLSVRLVQTSFVRRIDWRGIAVGRGVQISSDPKRVS